MPFRLSRLNSTFAIVDQEGRPSGTFQRWWQTFVETVEDAVQNIRTIILETIPGVEETADGALALAQSAINPGGTIKDNKVLTESMTPAAATDPWRVASSSVIAFGAATKTQILSVTVNKAEDDSYLEIACQIPFAGADAIDIDVSFEAQQAGVPIQSSPTYRIQLDANNATILPWAYVDELDALDAGTYDIKVFGERYSANAVQTAGTYKQRVREFKR